jgi:hypothetical protein
MVGVDARGTSILLTPGKKSQAALSLAVSSSSGGARMIGGSLGFLPCRLAVNCVLWRWRIAHVSSAALMLQINDHIWQPDCAIHAIVIMLEPRIVFDQASATRVCADRATPSMSLLSERPHFTGTADLSSGCARVQRKPDYPFRSIRNRSSSTGVIIDQFRKIRHDRSAFVKKKRDVESGASPWIRN